MKSALANAKTASANDFSQARPMQWQHYNKFISSMWYIEKLLREIDTTLDEREKNIYKPVRMDLTKRQVALIKKQLKKLYSELEEVTRIFGIKPESISASRIIDANTGFIWETIEDTWSSRIEKTSGKIKSDDEKNKIDESLARILESTNMIRKITKYDAIKTK